MNEAEDIDDILFGIRKAAADGDIRITQHAHQEMVEENITLDDLLESIGSGHVLENYPNHQRGSCCLVSGFTDSLRPLHTVCTTRRRPLILITAYEPKLPKWLTPLQRNRPE